MHAIESKPTLDDRHVRVIWLSRAGYVMGADGRPVEVEPSPASAVVAEVAEKHLTVRLFPPGRHCMSRLEIAEICSLREGLNTWPDMKSVIGITSPSCSSRLSLTGAFRTLSPKRS